jgi:arsenate reductase (thioredoxin)
MTESKKSILFLCTGNAARSQMAEALARIDYPDIVAPVSAGSRPAGFVHPMAVQAIGELGVSIARARSKSAEEFYATPIDLVVTVCDSAAADCPKWPAARHVVHWSVEDPSFVSGEAARLKAFRATRDDLRQRIDGLMEALRRSLPRRTDAELLERGTAILDDPLRSHGFKFVPSRSEEASRRPTAAGRFERRGRSLDLQVRSGVVIAQYAARERQMLHPDYMESLGASAAMRYPGLSRDSLDAFRRLRTDLVRFAGPFLSGKALDEFERFAEARAAKKGPAKSA